MENKYNLLIEKLDGFLRKYYKNQLIRGGLIGTSILLAFYLLVSVSEYWAYFPVVIRTTIIIIGVLLFFFVLILLIIRPLLKLFKLGVQLTNKDAAYIINKHFPQLQDKLINTIELAERMNPPDEDTTLLIASINQRIETIRIIPFGQAINLRQNLKYLKVIVPLMIIGLIIWWLKPSVYEASAERLIHFRQKFEPPAKYSFILKNDSLEVEKGGDFTLRLNVEGDKIPAEIYCCFGGSNFLMKEEKINKFTYTFRNINNNILFNIKALKISSKNYILKVMTPPSILEFFVKIKPPLYTQIKPSIEKNLGDLLVPQGSEIQWTFITDQTDNLQLRISTFNKNSNTIRVEKKNNKFVEKRKFLKPTKYSIILNNVQFEKRELLKHEINIIPDRHPQIQVASITDTLQPSIFYFKGIIKDDYGFSGLQFKYSITNGEEQTVPINFNPHQKAQEYYFAFDFKDLEIDEGTTVSYFFEVIDNDAVNGVKTSRTGAQTFLKPSSEQLFQLNEQLQDGLSDDLQKSLELSRTIQRDIEHLQQSYIQNPGDDWQKQQLFKNIQAKREQLESLIKQVEEENIRKNKLLNSFEQQDSILLEKQKQIEELFSKVMDEELQKLLEEFNKLSENFDAEKLNKLGEGLKMSFEDIQKQLDRNLELLKRYEIEAQTKQLAERLEQLSQSQNKLAQEKNKSAEEVLRKHRKNSYKVEKAEEDYHKILQKNEELKKPLQMSKLEPEFEEIKETMQKTEEQINEKKNRKASENMRKTAKGLENISKKIQGNLAQNLNMQISIDIDNLKRLLNNLVQFSFDQENLLYQLRDVDYRDPRFPKIMQEQSLQKEKYRTLQDSLIELSNQSPQVAIAMGSLIFEIERNLDKTMQSFIARQKRKTLINQQEIMTQTNDLAVFLSEALKHLLNQMANAMPGEQMSEKNGKSMPFPKDLKNQQKSLKNQLKQMIDDIKGGKKQKEGTNRELAKMLRKQETYRNTIRELLQQGGVQTQTEKKLKEIMKKMEQIETDIANFSVNSNTILRQEQILKLLLEAENAEKQKDWEHKRESKQANKIKLSNPNEKFQYNKVQIDFNDNFYNTNVKMFNYYNNLYLEYMINFNND